VTDGAVKTELAVNSDFIDPVMSCEAISDALSLIKAAGFTHVHWCHDWETEYMYTSFEMEKIKKLTEENGLAVNGIHASEGGVRARHVNGELRFINRYRNKENRKDYTSPDELTRRAGVELVKNRAELAHALGAHVIVLHMQLPYEELRASESAGREYWDSVMRSLGELEGFCVQRDVKIAFENMICTPQEEQRKQFDRLFGSFSPDFIGFCFDSGHAALVCPEDTLYFAKRYRERLIFLHLHDNDGIAPGMRENDAAHLMADRHRTPFTGIVRWDELAGIVAASPCALPLTLEVVVRYDTREGRLSGLIKAREAGERLDGMVRAHRRTGAR
jgi:sugar phosphate isomerase/epimerase